ncbi:hypothetical protein Pint_16014 [Pistacia integerrima]|uniref:Uncharacterized protein n=1 Tax=Pistacia integerrima TaxID=434235 RepID=A0ACC0ZDP6_9ROSI|nr:hypothetical protein Pint_16014 [Pistacia integerrima]
MNVYAPNLAMKGVFSAPGDYVHFKSQVPLHKIPIGTKQWRYYDFGPKVVPPLICLPGTAGTAEVYYKQIMSLSMKVGYRVISVDIPRVWNHHEWIQAFEKFLDAIDVHHVRVPCILQYMLLLTAFSSPTYLPLNHITYILILEACLYTKMPANLDHKFLHFKVIHLYGTSLGGFLAQLFAQHRPRRVRSLVLSNTFLDTRSFAAAMPWAPIVSWTPSFLLKRYILTGIRDGPHEPFIADSVDFVVSQVMSVMAPWALTVWSFFQMVLLSLESFSFLLAFFLLLSLAFFTVYQHPGRGGLVETLSREDLASRLTLTVDAASVGTLLLSDSYITIMDTNDYCATPQPLKDHLSERYPGARRAYLKTGGDFPFLSRPDEVNLHLQLHLRRVGVEAQPDLVRGISKDGTGGNPSEKNDGKEDPDNPPKDNGGNSESPSTESQLPPPESSESHSIDDQPLSNSKGCLVGHGDTMLLLPRELLRNQQIMAAEILLQIA